MQAIEAERTIQEISRAFRRTTNTTELHDFFRDNIQVVTDRDNLIGNGIVSTALTQGAGQTLDNHF